MPLVAAMAAVTSHLGFGVTVNLSHEQPYLLARRFSTLDQLTRGHIGWNVVTGYLDSAACAMGGPRSPSTMPATTAPTSSWRSPTSSGRAAGITTPSCATARTASTPGQTKRQLLAEMAIGGRYPLIVGSPARVVDELLRWVAETGIDGFNLARTVTPECFEDIVEWIVPELQNRGAYKTAHADGTLRQKPPASE